MTRSTVVVTGLDLRLAATGPIMAAAPCRFSLDPPGDRSAALATETIRAAWHAANPDVAPERTAATMTVSKLGVEGLLRTLDAGAVTAAAWSDFLAPSAASDLAHGPVEMTVAACASGLISWIRAAMLLENGECDVAVAGAAEGALHPLIVAGFRNMQVLSKTKPRPFDRRRDGFVPCEGAAAVILERETDARARGVRPQARLRGWAMRSEAAHVVASGIDGGAVTRLVRAALTSARLDLSDVSFVHLHGTGTIQNDLAESAALRTLFDDRGLAPPAISTKGRTGHCLGAAGAVAAALTVGILNERRTEPTCGLEEIDEACRTECLITGPKELDGAIGLVLSYGFGGHMAALVLEGCGG